jgi:ABC-type hemin transport system ATPase subunit
MILKAGRTLTAGKTKDTLTNSTLSQAFGHPCAVEHHNARYYLRLS